jgi:hypothetical protein
MFSRLCLHIPEAPPARMLISGSGRRARTRLALVVAAATLALAAITRFLVAPAAAPRDELAPSTPSPTDVSTGTRPPTSSAASDATAPAGVRLVRLEGTGDGSSTEFAASGESVQMRYDFDCAQLGHPGDFDVTFDDRNGVVADAVREHGASGENSTTVYISNTAPPYHVEVRTTCSWAVEVVGFP